MLTFLLFFFFFFNDTATTEIYTLSLHDALPIFGALVPVDEPVEPRLEDVVLERHVGAPVEDPGLDPADVRGTGDRKSTRLNSSHANISYAVFCLKKKKTISTHSATSGSPSISSQ